MFRSFQWYWDSLAIPFEMKSVTYICVISNSAYSFENYSKTKKLQFSIFIAILIWEY